MPRDLYPVGLPPELVSAALVSSNEPAWRPAEATKCVEWLGLHGYAVLGTEILLPKSGSIQSLPYRQHVDRNAGEQWDAFVRRSAAETLAYLIVFARKFVQESDAYVSVIWVDEAGFKTQLKE